MKDGEKGFWLFGVVDVCSFAVEYVNFSYNVGHMSSSRT